MTHSDGVAASAAQQQLAAVAAQLLRLERNVFALLTGAWEDGGRAQWIAQVRGKHRRII